MSPRHGLAAVLIAALLSACAANQPPAAAPQAAGAAASAPSAPSAGHAATAGPAVKRDAGSRIGEAATSPLSDLNLVGEKLPELLQEARRHPYAPPSDGSCAGLQLSIQVLDDLLGPDLDSPEVQGERDLLERGGDALGDAAISGLRGAAEGILPFRGWLRRLSGADKRDREIASALRAGWVRRGYLRGLAAAQRCP
ncbi:hypothetical protein RQP53_01300 [Paucibacter sp. APW11]|uniref:Uncharacterized protein n=1 Tax=Roseateles aquae TaxID=3077235 RepID=A0ABU3P5P7_9BURK|nr:hypothetical protein [Paucibacter sp. APW11]MDT8997906.1 hypothetical protein [Paucibacter sp. APW11]